MAQTTIPVQLKPQTLEAFDSYIRGASSGHGKDIERQGPISVV